MESTVEFALDLETAPNHGDLSNGYALEPWRVRHKTARITSAALVGTEGTEIQLLEPQKDRLRSLLASLKDRIVWAHNAVFDVAWLIATLQPDRAGPIPKEILDIRWRDTRLLAKWVNNGQAAEDSKFSYSLKNLIPYYFAGQPGVAEFAAMKDNVPMDPSSDYWEKRGMLDSIWTLRLAHLLMEKLDPESLNGFVIEQRSIPVIANSWLIGIRVDRDALKDAETEIASFIKTTCSEIGIAESVISSPTQLGELVYNKWGLPVIAKTPKGKPSTASDTMKLLEYQTQHPLLSKIMRVKEYQTLYSKYIKSAYEALDRTTDNYLYAVPQIFGTNTGRLTYSSKTLDFKVSIAAHQIPRKAKMIRKYLCPPEGMLVCEADAMAQESRIMAIWSEDPTMIRIFSENMNFHSYTACDISGRTYSEFMDKLNKEDFETNEQRQNGKLLNLSANFRIGGKSLAHKSFTEYDRYMSVDDGMYLVRMWQNTYRGVPEYWSRMIHFAKTNGYTVTIAGRKFRVNKWDQKNRFNTEGIVISHPIQGTAGEQFHASLSQVRDRQLMTTLHDASFFCIKDPEEAKEIEHALNSTPYEDLWNVNLPVKLPYEVKVGKSFAEVK